MLFISLFAVISGGHTCGNCGTDPAANAGEKHGGWGMFLVHADTLDGGYVVSSVALWGKASDTLVLDSLPNGAAIKSAFLIWSIVADSSDSSMLLDSTQVSSVLAGISPTPCRAGYGDSTFTYYADVSSLITDTGHYVLEGFHSSTTEGASLVVIYSLNSEPKRNLVLYSGSYTLTGGLTGEYRWDITGFEAEDTVDHAHITYIFDDGQDYEVSVCGREYIFYDTVCLDSGATTIPGSVGAYWDALEFDVASVTPANATSVNVGYATKSDTDTGGCTDCIGIAGLVFEVDTYEPTTVDEVKNQAQGLMLSGPGWIAITRPVPNASLNLYSSDGRLIRVLSSGTVRAGFYRPTGLNPGVFVARLDWGSGSQSIKMVLR